jgi:hypothetical protein
LENYKQSKEVAGVTFFICRKARRAFLLVEVIVSVMVISLTAAGIMLGALAFLETGRYAEDVGAARERAEHVFSMIKLPLDHCGYGMPSDPYEYRKAFSEIKLEPFSWGGAISINNVILSKAGGGGRRMDAVCRIAFGLPSGVRVKKEISASPDRLEVIAREKPSLLEIVGAGDNPDFVKNWALLGAILPRQRPLWLDNSSKSVSDETILLFKPGGGPISQDRVFIPENDEIFYLGAISCYVDFFEGDYAFFIRDFRGGGGQPKVAGVADARFELDDSKKLLKVTLLVRGNRRYDRVKTAGTPVGWPEKYAPDIPAPLRRYRLFAYTESFGLKNLR